MRTIFNHLIGFALIAFFFLFCQIHVYGANAYFSDGKMKMAYSEVDGQYCKDKPEEDQLKTDKTKVAFGTITAHTPVVVKPSENEVNLSSCPVKFENYSQWVNINSGDKLELSKLANQLKRKYEEYELVPSSKEYLDYLDRYNWLKDYLQKLP